MFGLVSFPVRQYWVGYDFTFKVFLLLILILTTLSCRRLVVSSLLLLHGTLLLSPKDRKRLRLPSGICRVDSLSLHQDRETNRDEHKSNFGTGNSRINFLLHFFSLRLNSSCFSTS